MIDLIGIRTIIRRPITSPACSRAQGIDRRDVPIIVFQIAKLKHLITFIDVDHNVEDDYDDVGDDEVYDVDAHMVTMLLCLPAAGETPRNWIWKKEAGIACSGMFCGINMVILMIMMHSCFVEKFKISKINGKTILTLVRPSRAPERKS